MKFKNKKRTGLTIIELLLGLSIFVLISLTVYSTFFGGIRLSQRARVQNDVYSEIRMSFELISRELQSMLVYDFSNSYPDMFSFKGSSEAITFFRPTDEGIKVVSYYLIEPEQVSVYEINIGKSTSRNVTVENTTITSARANYLLRAEKDFAAYLNNPTFLDAEAEIICMRIKEDSLAFSYGYQASEDSENISYVGEWTHSDIPSIVRLKLEFLADDDASTGILLSKDVYIPQGYWGEKEDL